MTYELELVLLQTKLGQIFGFEQYDADGYPIEEEAPEDDLEDDSTYGDDLDDGFETEPTDENIPEEKENTDW